jgi:hypothetical protein
MQSRPGTKTSISAMVFKGDVEVRFCTVSVRRASGVGEAPRLSQFDDGPFFNSRLEGLEKDAAVVSN